MPIDYKRYPHNWKSEIVPTVLERAKNCCEDCGLVNGSDVFGVKMWIKDSSGRYKLRSIWFRDERDAKRECTMFVVRKIRVVLTIAHLDHDETNHDVAIDRLKALCQCCHLRYDANEKYRRQMAKWSKPQSIFNDR